ARSAILLPQRNDCLDCVADYQHGDRCRVGAMGERRRMGHLDGLFGLCVHRNSLLRRDRVPQICAPNSGEVMISCPLSGLFAHGRPAGAPVAQTDGITVNFARFRADVAANSRRIVRLRTQRGLLATADAYWGAVGMLALMHAGAEVIVPQNTQPATLEAMSGAWDLLVCDSTPKHGSRALVLEVGRNGADSALTYIDRNLPITFFTSGSTGEPKRIPKTLAHLEREAEAVDLILGPIAPDNAWIEATVSHQHVYGLTFRVCWALATGRTFVGEAH